MTAPSDKIVDALRAALRDNERLKQRNQRLEQVAREPIAIVGMGCRLPGGVNSPERLWRLVAAGEDAISRFPDRPGWEFDSLVDPDPDRRGTTYVSQGGFLHDADQFDAGFFGISPREALAMDPQQRLLLEVAWETLENARISPAALRGTTTGVFTGATGQDYGPFVHQSGVDTEGYLATGTATSVASGRIAYVLGLEGPAVTVDTACSTSLVALHLAVQSLRSGECSLALAGGAQLMTTPSTFREFSRQRGLAPDGRCKPFSDDADGTAWSEGVGLLLVERLSDARRNGHRVLAVVRGTAANQDGASNGLTAPSGLAQQRVIRQALANAGMTSAEVDVVEAHGTGTTLGDPIEAQALLATYGQERPEGRPLWLGSIKSNIGHAQGAAGVAGVMKMVLAMRHGLMPKSLHVGMPSSHVDWDAGAVELLSEARPWPGEEGRPRRAGVSAFGMSGTNAHVILEEAPPLEVPEPVAVESSSVVPWILSGRSAEVLRGQAGALGSVVDGADAGGVGWSLATARARFEHRAVVTGAYGTGLAALAAGEPSAQVVSGVAGPVGRTAFVFPGQGAQWAAMGAQLLDASPVFAGVVAECEVVMASLVDWSVTDVLRGGVDAPSLERVDVVQPASFVVMVALAALWRSYGVEPAAVVGHSQGEIAAAYVAGVLSLEDALHVVVARAAAIAAVASGEGTMASVGIPAEQAEELFGDRVAIAAVNGPSQVVISGEVAAVGEVVAECGGLGIRARRIAVDYASHSPAMDVLRADLAEELGGITPRAGDIPLLSTVTADFADPLTMDGDYWFTNLRSRVRFAEAVGKLVEDGFGVFVEVSSHPVLTGSVEEMVDEGIVAGSLRRDDGGLDRFLAGAAELWVRGVDVDWTAAFPATRPALVDLPTYAFQRQGYWPKLPVEAVVAADEGTVAEREFWAAVERADVDVLAGTLGTDVAVLDPLLPVLAEWRQKQREQDTTDSWRYEVKWRPWSNGGTRPALTGTWLVVLPEDEAEGECAAGVVDALRTHGADVHTLVLSDDLAGRPLIAERLRDLVPQPDGVLSLLALDERPHPERPAVPAGLAATVELVQALGDADLDAPVWLATRGAVGIGPSDPPGSVPQAAAWGLGRVVGLEHPDRWGGLLDLPELLDARGAERLVAALADGGEDQIALRASGSFVRRLVHARPGDARIRPWRPHGTALLTGGTGGIGAELARWLAAEGIDHLVLTGRRGADAPGVPELRDELTAQGVGVTVAACDVADRAALAAVLDLVPEEHPLTAVVHAAGVGEFAPLAEHGLADLADVLTAKTLGAAHLDELLGDRLLDAFVLFSSSAGVWGSGGQSAYAAANAHLDALAHHRRSRGRVATSVAWGAWGGAGMAADEGMARHLGARGIRPMPPASALAALRAAVERDEAVAVVADMDWERFAPAFTAARPRPLLDELPEVGKALEDGQQDTGHDGADDALRRRLAGLTPAEQQRELLDLVRAHAAAVLGHADSAAVEQGRAFRELGFDSLTALELRNRLNAATGLRLPATLVFDHAQPRLLAAFLHTELGGGSAAQDTVAQGDGPAADEPIAIVGMSCRYPGDVRSPEDFWTLLADGIDALSPLPSDRGWPSVVGGVREGGFVHDAIDFDAGFFGMSPREALATDPQQRLLLETAWEAFEHAGIDPSSVRGSRTGVFIGCNSMGYGSGLPSVPEEVQGHLLVGNATSVVSGRIAYTLGLEGPAVTLDTACSSSLVALHWAAQSLRNGESTMALAGGVAVLVTPDSFTEFSRQGGLAADGRCKAFSDEADGTGWGEGAGVLVLERLSDARRNGHQVLAVVRGTATNQDGASNGLSAPSGPAQQRVIRQALANAGVSASDVDVVEAHGTGTTLGDPIEAHALLATYGQDRPADRPLWLGSVKSNIGHTQAAAGVAGIIKMVLALRHESLPKTLYAQTPSTHVDWSAGAVELLSEARQWPREDRPRRAGVSAFGISGTNAHVILEEAPAGPEPARGDLALPVVPWLVSARSCEGVAAQAGQLLSGVGGLDAVDVGVSLATTRAALEYRAFVLGEDADELRTRLGALAAGEPVPGLVTAAAGDGLTGFVFSGQGGQRVGMGRELAEAFPVFARALDEVCAYFDGLLDRPLREVMFTDAEALGETGWAQPALFAVEVALFRLLESWGVTPDYLVGHSVGELAAAHVAGVLSLEDACRLVSARAGLMQTLPSGGVMWAVRATVDEVTPLLGEDVSVAAVNAPGQVVLSGAREAVEAVAALLPDRKGRWLQVSHAFHSPLMDPMLDQFAEAAAEVTYDSSRIPIVSTLTGEPVSEFTPAYWTDQVRGTVRFADAITRLKDLGVTRLVELGPDASLLGAIEETYEDAAAMVSLLRRDKPEPVTAVAALAHLWAAGAEADWTAFFAPAGAQTTDLPTYAFQRRRYWLGTGPSAARDGWSYQVAWRRIADRRGRLTGRWLVVAPEAVAPLVAPVAEGLRAHGAQPVPVTLAPDADPAELLGGYTDVAGVICLPTRAAGPGPAPAGWLADVVRGLGEASVAAPLWCVTSGAVATGDVDAAPDPELAAVWGLGRVAALEHPDRWGGQVDLPAQPTARDLERLVGLLAADTGENEIAIRSAGMSVRRIERAARPTGSTGELPLGGTVLVTGGTGALGAHVARWLTGHGAQHLVLIGRRGPDAPGAAELREELTAAGARVTIAACDASDRNALAALIGELDTDGVHIDAVVHAAGVVDDGLLHTMTRQQLADVWAAKATAAAHLNDLLGERELSAFVLFSSLSGTLGAVGQAGYAAANAYLDTLAETRQRMGRPALSVAWGPWAGDGMAAGEGLAERLRHTGLIPMDAEAALSALERTLTGDVPCSVIAEVDWTRMTTGRPSGLLAELVAPADTAADVPGAIPTLRREVLALPEQARHAALLDAVRAQAADVLGHTSAAVVEPQAAFSALGFDSLLALDLRGRLSALTGLVLPATLVFDHPNAEALARHLLDALAGVRPDDAPTEVPAGVRDDDEPIAVVSMSCRFPGGLQTPEDLWRLLTDGADAMTAYPEDRGWDTASLYHPDPDHEGTSYAREGGFLHGVGNFDAELFGINPREALAMDPQQRLLLECSWEALERAGIDPKSVRGSRIGVFAGTNGQDYPAALHNSDANVAGYVATGSSASVFSGRVSYTFGLEGPALTVDTACSASLVALHLACQALRAGECGAALVGGASVMSTPGVFVEFSRQRALSPDGRCKAFSDDADGTGWGEGAAVVMVERLSDARRNGHPVLAVIRGTAVNQDGASNGLTAPSGPAQQRVVRQALAAAGLTPQDVDVVEAHGTGTSLGDPIEAQALLATYGQDRPADRPLWLGSVKSNIGHTQAAAGLAGVLKMVLALRHATLPKTLHVSAPSSHVDWGDGGVRLLTEERAWPDHGRPRRAGVSAFGVSGTNAHAILEQAPDAPDQAAETAVEEPDSPVVPQPATPLSYALPWMLSAKTPEGLVGQAARLLTAVSGPAAPVDVAWSLVTSRAALDHRAAVIGATPEELTAGLAALADGREAANVITSAAGSPGRTVFVFPGQGAQWAGMATELMDTSAVFAARIAECEEALAEFVEWSLSEVLRGAPGAPAYDRVDVVQPALFAVMVALAELWQSCGVRPHAVIGHSQGEIAAACVAGALSLRDAARIVALRSQALTELAGSGGMVSVMLDAEAAADLVAAQDGLSLAAVNGPASVVVSGDTEALDALLADCAERGVRARRIPVDYASHSAHVDRIHEDLLNALRPTRPQRPVIPMLSTLTGEWIAADELDADYWFRNLRQPVLLDPAVRTLTGQGHRTFVEMSPHPVLTVPVRETLDDLAVTAGRTFVGGSLRRDDGGPRRFMTSLAEAGVSGVDIEWTDVFAGAGPTRVDLPTYAFQRRMYWPHPAAAAGTAAAADPVDRSFWAAVEEENTAGLADRLGVGASTLAEVLPALSAWRRTRHEAAALDSWRYRVEWRPLAAAGQPGRLSGTWLVLTPENTGTTEATEAFDWPAAVSSALHGPGVDVLPVAVDTATATRESLAELLRAHRPESGTVRGVLSLLGVDERAHPAHDALSGGVAATLQLAQAMVDAGFDAPLWLATRAAELACPADRIESPAQRQIWGLGRVVGLEHPDRWGGLVDLPARLDEPAAEWLRQVLADSGDEDQLAVRRGGVFVRRLVPAPLGDTPPSRDWQPRDTALVTGGSGGLGARAARWLAEAGAEHLVLISRRGAEAPGAEELRDELTALGARVTLAACDVSDRAALAALLDDIHASGDRIRTVVHAAGVVQATPLTEMSLGECAAVLAAKAQGAAHLDDLLGELELDAFVLFSSNAGVWGSGGQAAYAAANASLDALAQSRRARGRTATSVAWGAWAGGGMAAGPAAEEQLRRRGILTMSPERALAALQQALEFDETLLAVADVDWSRFATAFAAARPRPLLDELPAVRAALARTAPEEATRTGSDPGGRLRTMPAAERDAALLDLVRSAVAAVLGHEGSESIEVSRAFKDLGFDSLTSVELRNRLTAATGLTLPATLVFDHPTPLDLTRLLRAGFAGDQHEQLPPDQAVLQELDKLEAGISALSPDHDLDSVQARLRSLLSSLGDRQSANDAVPVTRKLETATDDELFEFIHREFGKSS
ncbi:acyl transferase domain-containing protein/acyl carrier protein [Streptomyces umbrinus]|uniref:Acyl transferase domain-containing protein/acyl carrier protein n=1 Tax=Streptomyces umbrinus TaxID=67370 RepID=A0ABU0SP55_9ACTN|nr:type I polyketide synthase [Streptomyces umbrinus]MDQ1025087.1 acyl transferase domain-containing protein/acyl carrier protein [Streptomyces umbrinus]